MQIKLSVIIPVYNAERCLRACLDSVLGQSLREIEVLCVDDGSTDASAAILTEYAARDERLRILTRQNGGAGIARNTGLEQAAGDHVFFLDADDLVLDGALESLYNMARDKRLDVLRCRALDLDNQSGRISRGVHNALRRVPPLLFGRVFCYPEHFWLFPKVNVAPWGGLFRRAFLLEQGIRFHDLVCVNDRSFFWETVLKARRVAFCKTDVIQYRMNMSGSLVGLRLRNFDCHFASYALVSALCDNLPIRYRRSILNGELLDLASWYAAAMGTGLREDVRGMTAAFLERMDKSPWDDNIETTKWYRRIKAAEGKT